MVPEVTGALEIADSRRQGFASYAEVRAVSVSDPRAAHARWRNQRDTLFASHPASPLLPADRADFDGLRVADYDPGWRFDAMIQPPIEPCVLASPDNVVAVEIPVGEC